MSTILYAGIDAGTTGTRTMIFDEEFRVISSSYVKNSFIFPREGWVEQDPYELIENLRITFKNALEKTNLGKESISSIGIANQRETIIGWNKITGVPYGNAIVWQDTRAQPYTESLKGQGFRALIRERTGLELSTYFSAGKIKWILEHILKDKKKANEALFGTVDSWIVWNLTNGRFVTDFSNASRTMLMNLKKLEWDEELLEIFGIQHNSLPEIVPSYGNEIKLENSLSPKGNINSIMGDQHSSLFGQFCFKRGSTKATIGTGTFVLQNVERNPGMRERGLLTTVAFGKSKNSCSYALEGSVPVSGSIIDWLIRGNFIKDKERAFSILKERSGKGRDEDLYFVPSFNGIYSPYWDGSSRGLIIGITARTTVESIVMSSYEAIVFQLMDVIRTLKYSPHSMKLDGGPASNQYLMQLIADYTQTEVVVPEINETTAFGAAMTSSIGIDGIEGNPDPKMFDLRFKVYEPSSRNPNSTQRYERWRKAVSKSRGWAGTTERL